MVLYIFFSFQAEVHRIVNWSVECDWLFCWVSGQVQYNPRNALILFFSSEYEYILCIRHLHIENCTNFFYFLKGIPSFETLFEFLGFNYAEKYKIYAFFLIGTKFWNQSQILIYIFPNSHLIKMFSFTKKQWNKQVYLCNFEVQEQIFIWKQLINTH